MLLSASMIAIEVRTPSEEESILVTTMDRTKQAINPLNILPEAVQARIATISADERSFQYRLYFARDAFFMWNDYPWIGAGGGAWQALYPQYRPFPYFTTEVHNHFLQVAVEVGLLGLTVFVLLWLLFFYQLLYLRWRHPPLAALSWTVAVAFAALLVHAFFDYDLSFAAFSFWLWAFFGAMYGLYRSEVSHLQQANAFSRNLSKRIKRKKRALAGFLLILAFALLLPSSALVIAKNYATKAQAAAEANETLEAQRLMAQAYRWNPYSASYALALASMKGASAQTDPDKAYLLEKAYNLHRGDPAVAIAWGRHLIASGQLEAGIAALEEALRRRPWSAPPLSAQALKEQSVATYVLEPYRGESPYKALAEGYLDAALAARSQGQDEQAQQWLEQLQALPMRYEEEAKTVPQRGKDPDLPMILDHLSEAATALKR
ncbi:O-antigen ligase family protein [Heliorestis convoluta]|uniref:O-antigen ligase like membrane family protein n=1 Tax=Heliorestis convoluta TaxID=356322 RepID=A0A5Q2MYX9_9FIRM|nr:O-antigen ligase family protein [Heliorestis convoluta]QGG46609.1 O-antigen ligase like membrane family protein [Heliorestis convoluta]